LPRPEGDSFIKYQIDHIVSLRHGGATVADNLAFCCPICNNYKGADLGTVLDDEAVVVRLFNPRRQNWFEHFEVVEGAIYSKTPTGEATIKLLEFNEISRILERLDLVAAGIFP
jgi:hypothetical protein